MADDSEHSIDHPYEEYEIVREREKTDDVRWIGIGEGSSMAAPWMYDENEGAMYPGEVDDEERIVRVNENERRDLDENETLGDRVAEIGDDHGWHWLSEFAHENLETTDHDAHMDVIDAKFDRRNVADDADYDVGFFGSFTYRDDDGRVHTLEREFQVFTDEAHRTETDMPVAVVEETYLTAEEPMADRRAGDAELENQTSRELPIEIDPDAADELVAIHEFCEEWHESHPEPMGASS